MDHPVKDYAKNHRPTHSLKVLEVKRYSDGRFVDLWIEKPKDMVFEGLGSVGIPGSLGKADLAEMRGLLAQAAPVARSLLVPRNGHPAPNLAYPSDRFLARLFDKAGKAAGVGAGQQARIGQQRVACLWYAMAGQETRARLQANYTVVDLLRLFPNIMTEQDIVETQPPESGNKTYTVDATSETRMHGRPCFRLSIAQDDGPAYRALFGEAAPLGSKPGQTSTYLRSLTRGDHLAVNRKVKGKSAKGALMDPQRPILLVAQGNAMIKMISVLEVIRASRKGQGQTGKVLLIGAFQTHGDVLELERLKPYLADGTLDELHLCLSREPARASHSKGKLHLHYGDRVQQMLAKWRPSFAAKPFIYVTGGKAFCKDAGSVGAALSDYFARQFPATHSKGKADKCETSSSSNRRHSLQGQPYPPTDVAEAVRLFQRSLMPASPRCNNP